AHQLRDLRQQSDLRISGRGHRRRSGQPARTDRRVSVAIEAGQLLRAPLHSAGRAALLAQRPDRGVSELFRLYGAAPSALPAGAAVGCTEFVIPGRGRSPQPESITTGCGYRFRPSPLLRLGRNDEFKPNGEESGSRFTRLLTVNLPLPQRF